MTDRGERSKPARVLVVDDDEANRRLLDRILSSKGYEVAQASGGLAALERLMEGGIDLVLLDLMMPGMSGIEVLDEIRASQPAHELPVVIATARTDSEILVDALARGANDYVTKPFDREVLLARIAARLSIDRRPASPSSRPLLDDRYVLEEPIGQGGESTVYKGRHVELEKPVAIKVIKLQKPDPARLRRLREEGMAACRVDHPNAVEVLDFGSTGSGEAFLVMELLAGRDLSHELAAVGRHAVGRMAELIVPVAAVLQAAHGSGILHRDVKPANIFLHHGHRGETVKLLDFGVARLVNRQAHPSRGGIIGTLSYIAPERLLYQPHDGRSDVYSLATVAYELLTGNPPFDTRVFSDDDVAAMQVHTAPRPLGELRPDLPPRVVGLIMSALSKHPDDRPTASTFGIELGMAARLGVA